ncbi:hypothetical protein SRHO_G00080140 [Serrasalmus rhombeus]
MEANQAPSMPALSVAKDDDHSDPPNACRTFDSVRLQVTSTPPHFETDPWWQLLGERRDVSIRLSKEIARGSGGSPGANQTLHAAPTRCSFTSGGVELKKEKRG